MTALTFNVTELPMAKWLAWTFSTTGLYSSAKTADRESNDSFTLSCYTCFTFILPKDWKVQLDGSTARLWHTATSNCTISIL